MQAACLLSKHAHFQMRLPAQTQRKAPSRQRYRGWARSAATWAAVMEVCGLPN